MKLFTAVLLAVSLSAAGAASAAAPAKMHKPMMHHRVHVMAACAVGAAVKASCVCKSASGAKATCKAGQWCHSFIGICTQ